MKKIVSLLLISASLQAMELDHRPPKKKTRLSHILEDPYYDEDQGSSSNFVCPQEIEGFSEKQVATTNFNPSNNGNMTFAKWIQGYKKVKGITSSRFSRKQRKKGYLTREGILFLHKFLPEHIINHITSYVIGSMDKSELVWIDPTPYLSQTQRHASNSYIITQDPEKNTTTITCDIHSGCKIGKTLNTIEPYCTTQHQPEKLRALWRYLQRNFVEDYVIENQLIKNPRLNKYGTISHLVQIDPTTVITTNSDRNLYSWDITPWNELHKKILSQRWNLYATMALQGYLQDPTIDLCLKTDPDADIIQVLTKEVRAPLVYETEIEEEPDDESDENL